MKHLDTYQEWIKHQGFEGHSFSAEMEAVLQQSYQRALEDAAAIDVHSVVRDRCKVGEYRYAVAIEDDRGLWLTLWVQRSPKGEYFVFQPRDKEWDPHASYHINGNYHQKSRNVKLAHQQRQRLDRFSGAEHLGFFYGHDVEMAVCYPEAFTRVIRVPPGILEPMSGAVLIDLVEPGEAPAPHHRCVPGLQIVKEEAFRDCSPWIVIAIAANVPLPKDG